MPTWAVHMQHFAYLHFVFVNGKKRPVSISLPFSGYDTVPTLVGIFHIRNCFLQYLDVSIISKWPSHKSGHEREKQKDAEWDNWKRSSGCSYCGLRSHVSSATVSSCSHPTPSPSSCFLKDSGSSSAYSTHSTLHLTCPNMISPVKINSATSKEHVE